MNYTWTIKLMKKQNIESLTDVVIQVYWDCVGTDADGDTGIFHGATPFTLGSSFTPFEELTEAQVLGWIQAEVDSNPGYKAHIEEVIAKQVAAAKNPVSEVTAFPWSPEAPGGVYAP